MRRALAVFGIVVGAVALAPASTMPAASAAPCAYAPASIAVVVDFGDGSPVSAVCVPASSTDNGASVLAARAEALGTTAPRFNSSGLLCAIDGTPSEGCGEQTGSKYAYWSYWHGSPDTVPPWSYSNVGPGGSRVHATTVEGWRFQPEGAGNPSDPAPRGSADPAATCAPPSQSPTTTSAPEGSPMSSGTETGATQSAATSTGSGDAAAEPESTTVVSSSASSSATTTSTLVAAAPVRVTAREKGGGPTWSLFAGGGLLAALGVSGAVIARRRRTTP
jgi:hypothetical protein